MATTSPIIISYFADRQDNNPRQGEATWDQLVEGLSKARPTPCTEANCQHSECPFKDGPSWSPASYLAGTYRGKQNVATVGVLVIDIDHVPTDDALAEALDTLDDYQYIIHSSHSDREGDHCVRVVVALSRPVQGSEWPRFWRAAMDTLKVPVDEQTKDASRLFYLPSRPSDTWYLFDTNDGKVLDVDDVLANAPEIVEAELSPVEAISDEEMPSLDAQQRAADALAAAWPKEHNKHQAQLALSGALANAGWSVETVAGFVTYVCDKAEPGNGNYEKRMIAARSSVEKARRGEAVRGWPSLKEFVSAEAVQKATDELGLNKAPERDQSFTTALAKLATATPPPVTHDAPPDFEILNEMKKAANYRGSDSDKSQDADLIKNVIRIDHFITDSRELARTAIALVRATPKGTTVEQYRERLKVCTATPLLGDIVEVVTRALEFVHNPPPSDDQEEHDIFAEFIKTDKGEPRVCGSNIELVLRNAEELRGRIRFNELTKQIEITDGPFSGLAMNNLDVAVKNWLEKRWHIHPMPTPLVGEQLLYVARQYGSYNPVKEYLESVTWDGVKQIGGSDAPSWLTTFCGVEDNEYIRAVGSKFLISAVARAYEPGAKVDTVLILEGRQGAGKSTVFSILGGQWFTDTPIQMGDKDSRMLAASKWIAELAELSSLSTRDTESVKAFLTSCKDDFRPPYGRVTEEFPRRVVFGGTTNEEQYLQDQKNRRFWAARVGTIRIEAFKAARDQLWAEAVERYKSGEKWWLDEAEEVLAEAVIAERRVENPWAGSILDWVRRQNFPTPGVQAGTIRTLWTTAEVAKGALGIELKDLHKQNKQVCQALREAGFTNNGGKKRVRDGERGNYWSKEGEVLHQEPKDVAPAPQILVEPGAN